MATLMVSCACGAGLEIERVETDANNGIFLHVKRCAGCDQDDYSRGYDDRVAEETRECAHEKCRQAHDECDLEHGVTDDDILSSLE